MSNRSNSLIKNDDHQRQLKRYTVEMSLFFVVLTKPLGEPSAIDITRDNEIENIGTVPKDELTFCHLKKMIWSQKPKFFSKVDYDVDELILWKVKGLSEGNNKWKLLDEKSPTKIDIKKELGGEKLSSTKKVRVAFPGDLPADSIHILVEPPPPATTGKRRLDYDWSEDRDRKKGKPSVPEAILTRAKKIMEDIKKLPEDRSVYSNPKTFILLPFPFPGNDKPERFSIKDGKFWYMGRKKFDGILNIILEELVFGDGCRKFFIYGTMGYGKSYILAAIVCFLFRTGKRVVYLPDCRELAVRTRDYIKYALYLTYENDSDKISKIYACKTLDEIVEFCNEESEPLYFIVDQMNALDLRNNTEIAKEKKATILDALNSMASNHYYIKSSSANNTSALHLKLKQTNERKTELYGGFDEDEMLQWWVKNDFNFPSMDDEQKKKIEYITGRNPLFLSFLLGSEKNFENALNHLKPILTEKIKKPMTGFSDLIKKERWDTHVNLMSSCLANGYALSGYGTEDYDNRFFYIDKDERCYYTSGFVRDCMADYLFEKGRLEVFATSNWIQCIKEFKNNPSVRGFMAEKACLSSIYRNGIMADGMNLKCDNYKFFTSLEEIDFSTNEERCTLYLPRLWNQKSFDGLITLCKMINKKEQVMEDTLFIAPIQITIDKKTHSNSEASFFSGIWPKLKPKILDNLKVEVIFIWIARKNDADYYIEAKKKISRQGINEINPQYKSIVRTFSSVNVELENVLSYY